MLRSVFVPGRMLTFPVRILFEWVLMLYNCLAVTVRNDRVYQGNRFQFSTTTAVAAAAIIIIISIPYRLSRIFGLIIIIIVN